MNPRTLQTIAFALGCILAVQSATTACAQNVATGANSDPQQPVASAPAATSTPAAQSPDSATSGGSQEAESLCKNWGHLVETPAKEANLPVPDLVLRKLLFFRRCSTSDFDIHESSRLERPVPDKKTPLVLVTTFPVLRARNRESTGRRSLKPSLALGYRYAFSTASRDLVRVFRYLKSELTVGVIEHYNRGCLIWPNARLQPLVLEIERVLRFLSNDGWRLTLRQQNGALEQALTVSPERWEDFVVLGRLGLIGCRCRIRQEFATPPG